MQKFILQIAVMGTTILLLAGCTATATIEPASPPVETTSAPETAAPVSNLPAVVEKMHWFGISSILYHGTKNIYFDPVMIEGNVPPADIILISHAHDDHANLEDLKRILSPNSVLIISPNVEGFYRTNEKEIGVPAVILDEGESTEVAGIRIKAVPAFDQQIHFRESKGMGFVVSVDGERIYFAGGTRMYPEMAEIENDVTIYPWYRNDDILAAAAILNTQVLIPVHAGASGVKAFVDLYGNEITRLKIIALDPGPYNP